MLTSIEEFDIITKFQFPHFLVKDDNIAFKKRVTFDVLHKSEQEIIILASDELLYDYVFAGLTEHHIEYIAKNGPKDYKENIMKILKDQEMMKGVFEIAKSMDEDSGRNLTENQDRVRNIIQYIKDNKVAFEF